AFPAMTRHDASPYYKRSRACTVDSRWHRQVASCPVQPYIKASGLLGAFVLKALVHKLFGEVFLRSGSVASVVAPCAPVTKQVARRGQFPAVVYVDALGQPLPQCVLVGEVLVGRLSHD